jgi:hypothetical protein
MKFDDIDISILFFLLDNPNRGVLTIAKKIFACDDKTARKKDPIVRFRLQEMEKQKIILCSPKSPKTYCVNPEYVFSGVGTLRINANGGGIIRVKFGDFLVITDNKEYVQINRIQRNGESRKSVEVVS